MYDALQFGQRSNMALLSYGTTTVKTPFIIADRLSVNHSIPILPETSPLEHAVLIRSNRSCRNASADSLPNGGHPISADDVNTLLYNYRTGCQERRLPTGVPLISSVRSSFDTEIEH